MVCLLSPRLTLAQGPADWGPAQAYGYPALGDQQRGAHQGFDGRAQSAQPSFDFAGPTGSEPWGSGRKAGSRSGYGSPESYGGDDPYGWTRSQDISGAPPSQPPGDRAGAWPNGEAFRFRGDKEISEGRWRELPTAPGYRFRPMSPEELERNTAGDGWRPMRREERKPAERGGLGPPSDQSSGYPENAWFRKYYGERP